MNYPTITPAFIRTFNPCYDPSKYLAENYSATVVEFLRHPEIPAVDKIWMVCQHGVLDDRTFELWAVWCAREALKLDANPDPRSVNVCDGAAACAARAAAWDAQILHLIEMLEAK